VWQETVADQLNRPFRQGPYSYYGLECLHHGIVADTRATFTVGHVWNLVDLEPGSDIVESCIGGDYPGVIHDQWT
jgi:hypothetical protein